jgi:polyketide cyclase/dehydrase/lipid transport protein
VRLVAQVGLSAALSVALAAPALAEPTDQERLARGEIVVRAEAVEGSKLPRIVATGVVDAPPEQLWPLIDHCADYVRTMIHITGAAELSRVGTHVVCRLTVDLPFPFPDLTSTTEAEHTVVPGVRYERRWKLVEGDYDENSGAWILVPYDQAGRRTLVTYEMHAVPKIFVPSFLQRIAQRKSIPAMFEKLRAQVASADLSRALGSSPGSR